MDPSRFDDLLRTLADSRSRRRVLGLLSALSGLGMAEGGATARTRSRRQGVGAEACRTLSQSCTKKRPGIGRWRKCCAGLVCRDKVCRVKECSGFLGCGQGKGCCDGKCLDVQTDPKNCGQCGKDCGGSPCLGGRCLSTCVEGLTACNGACVDVLRDPAHCGTCGVTCDDGMTCQEGLCYPVCREVGEACSAEAACCEQSGRVACAGIDSSKANGRCGPAFLGDRCCTTEGWECQSACDCCGAMACINATCFYRAPGQECEDSAECYAGTCQIAQPKPDDSCLLPSNLPPPQLCCLDAGYDCGTSCQCCGTLTCQDGVCSSFGSG